MAPSDTNSRGSLPRVHSIRLVRVVGTAEAIRTRSTFIGKYSLRRLADRRPRGNRGSSRDRLDTGGRAPETGRSSNISRKCTGLPACRIASKRSSLWLSFRWAQSSPKLHTRLHPGARQAGWAPRMASSIFSREAMAGKVSTSSRSWPFPPARRVAQSRSAPLPHWRLQARGTRVPFHPRWRRQPRRGVRVRAMSSARAPLQLP